MSRQSEARMIITRRTQEKYDVNTVSPNLFGAPKSQKRSLEWPEITEMMEKTAGSVKLKGTMEIIFIWTREEASND